MEGSGLCSTEGNESLSNLSLEKQVNPILPAAPTGCLARTPYRPHTYVPFKAKPRRICALPPRPLNLSPSRLHLV